MLKKNLGIRSYHIMLYMESSLLLHIAFLCLGCDSNFACIIYTLWRSTFLFIKIVKIVIDKYQQNKHITSHLKSVNTKNTTTYDIRNPDPGLGQVQNVTG